MGVASFRGPASRTYDGPCCLGVYSRTALLEDNPWTNVTRSEKATRESVKKRLFWPITYYMGRTFLSFLRQ